MPWAAWTAWTRVAHGANLESTTGYVPLPNRLSAAARSNRRDNAWPTENRHQRAASPSIVKLRGGPQPGSESTNGYRG